VMRGLRFEDDGETAREYVRPAEKDMFR
jgi:hypothetical protein